jgi:hypothetical protein
MKAAQPSLLRVPMSYGNTLLLNDILKPADREIGVPEFQCEKFGLDHGPFRIHHRTFPTICHFRSFSTVTGL